MTFATLIQYLAAGVVDCLVTMVREEGFMALFKGLTASIILCSNPAIQFVSYERMKAMALHGRANQTMTSYGDCSHFHLFSAPPAPEIPHIFVLMAPEAPEIQ